MKKRNCKKTYATVTALLLLASAAQAREFDGSAEITFKGTSTLHDFEGSVQAAPFQATFSEDKKAEELRVSASTSVAILEMDTQNKKRDKKMFKMFKSKTYPLITGSMENALIPMTGSGEATLLLKIHGVEKEIPVTLSDFTHDDQTAQCKMSFSISLKAFGLTPPSVMGLIRVGDNVQVECIVKGTLK